MCANLQTVEMSSIIWLPNEISFMKLVLSKARRLRTLSVDSHPDDFDDPIIDLLNYKRASAQSRVMFEGNFFFIMGFSVFFLTCCVGVKVTANHSALLPVFIWRRYKQYTTPHALVRPNTVVCALA